MKGFAIPALSVAVVLAAVVAVASSQPGSLRTGLPEPETPFREPASPAARAAFSALSDPALRQAGARAVQGLRAEGFDIDGMLAQLGARASGVVLTSLPGQPRMLVAPGSGGICTIAFNEGGAGSSCASEAGAAGGRAFGVYGCLQQGDMAVHGLVPDGVPTVRMALRDGSSDDVGVHNNAVRYPLAPGTPDARLPVRVQWDGVDEPLPMPAGARC